MFTTISNIKTYYEVLTSENSVHNPHILFLHGWGGTSASLAPLAQQCTSTHTCIVVDLPGFGQTENPPANWGTHEYAEFVKQFIDTMHFPKPLTLVGHSFGGSLALCLAAKYPEYVRSLILCAPSWHRKTADAIRKSSGGLLRAFSHLPVISSLIQFVRCHFELAEKPFIRKIIYRILFPQSDLMKHPYLEENFKRIVTEDLTEVAKKVRQPTLILWGDQDTYTPVADANLLHTLIPGSSLQVFPSIRHDLPLKHIDLIVTPIRSFFH